jgi:hypothetical protein
MISLDDCHPSEEAASRRKVLFASLLAASTLAPFPNTTIAADAQDAIRPSGRPSMGVRRANYVTTTDGTEIYYQEWGEDGPSFSVMAGRSMPMSGTIR